MIAMSIHPSFVPQIAQWIADMLHGVGVTATSAQVTNAMYIVAVLAIISAIAVLIWRVSRAVAAGFIAMSLFGSLMGFLVSNHIIPSNALQVLWHSIGNLGIMFNEFLKTIAPGIPFPWL